MTERMLEVLPLGVFGSLVFTLVGMNPAPAQEPIPLVAPGQPPAPRLQPLPLPLPGQPGYPGQPAPPVQPAQGEGIEVLAKGPVHEAFAATAEAPVASPVVAKQPPEPIEELPPDQKPEGDNVQWIPGYWSWDEENSQFIWVSGFWRQPPPGRVWVPGSWREVKGGWQYVPGFWQELAPAQPQQPQQPQQPEIEYLPQPPQSIEIGPTVAAPNTTSVYVPGSWVWRGKYLWRPGVWIEHRRDWVWVPARYHWTPVGYVFSDGYWDYTLAHRGVLFAPVVIAQPVYTRRGFVYTPVYVVSEPCMTGALFVRRGHGHYYFGDYFEPRYATVGYSAWCGTVGRNGFAIGFGTGRTWGYDPLWSYYSVQYRNSPRWHGGVNDLYAGRYRGDVVRPPTTLVQQNTTINNITRTNVTNVTNNITVVNGTPTVNNRDVSNVAMVAPLRVAPDLQRTKFEAVSAERRRDEGVAAQQLRNVGTQRNKLETAAVAAPKPAPVAIPGAPKVAVQPQTIKLDVPKVAAQRARVTTDEAKAPPPNPLRTNTGPGAKIDPPRVNPPIVPPVNPAVAPKVNPPVVAPKVDPKPIALPPVVAPKVNPPVVAPKVNPPVAPPVNPQPKVDPKPIAIPPVAPKVNPPVAPPVVAPKVNPPTPKPVVPVVQPKPVAPPVVVAPPAAPPQPKPVAVAPPVPPKPVVAAPVVQPKPQPAPVAQPRPTAPPVKVVPPPPPKPPAKKSQ